MSFTTTLFKLINAASQISLDGYDADEFAFKTSRRLDPRDDILYVEFDLSEFDQGEWVFRDQEVEVNSDGYCEAVCTEDDVVHSFGFRVSRPITRGELDMSVTYIMRGFTDYESLRAAKRADPAWAADDGLTNYRLKDGQRVMLRVPTVAITNEGGILVGAGSEGVVKIARTPRVTQPEVREPRTYLYFANVDLKGPNGIMRARVPHNALRILR